MIRLMRPSTCRMRCESSRVSAASCCPKLKQISLPLALSAPPLFCRLALAFGLESLSALGIFSARSSDVPLAMA